MGLSFNLKRNDTPIAIESDQGTQNLRLIEMTAAVRDQYLDTVAARMHIVNGQPAGIKKFDGMQSDLLSRCLVKEDGKPVTPTEIQNWPASVVGALFEAAQKVNGLNKEEDREKKA